MTSSAAYRKPQSGINTSICCGLMLSPTKNIEARQMPYLQVVTKEWLRIFPPASGRFFTCVTAGGDMINVLPIPEGHLIRLVRRPSDSSTQRRSMARMPSCLCQNSGWKRTPNDWSR